MVNDLKIFMWVTSACNLSCPFCDEIYGRTKAKNYEMGMEELRTFIKSSQDRKLHYLTICVTGGEVSLWSHFEEGIKLLFDSKICDNITLSTNGNQPEKVIGVSPMLQYWVVSKTQATPEQLEKYRGFHHKIVFNDTPHKKAPTQRVEGKLPAVCCCSQEYLPPGVFGKKYNGLLYLRGRVYYCIFAFSLSEYVDLVKNDLVCDFKDDFVSKFGGKEYDKEICNYCLCNRRIWEVTPYPGKEEGK